MDMLTKNRFKDLQTENSGLGKETLFYDLLLENGGVFRKVFEAPASRKLDIFKDILTGFSTNFCLKIILRPSACRFFKRNIFRKYFPNLQTYIVNI